MEDKQNLQNGTQSDFDQSVSVQAVGSVASGEGEAIPKKEAMGQEVSEEVSTSQGVQSVSQDDDGGEVAVAGDNNSKQIDWQKVEIDEKILDIVSVESLSKFRFIPFEMDDEVIKVAVVDESDLNTQNALRFFSRKNKKRLEIYPISLDDFESLIKKTKKLSLEIGDALDIYEKKEEAASAGGIKLRKRKEEVRILKDAPIAKMVESIVENAIDSGASDIHIEAMAGNVRVRYRIDGDLKTVITLPKKIGPALVSRIKILSNLKIDEKRKPQDGRFRINDLGKTIDFRVSSFPTAYGEKVVMRILDTQSGLLTLDKLGVQGRDKEVIERMVKEPYGIILITGPTGSGKSTTLYSMLRIVNKEEVNIITLEDPIEYVLEGINQSQVRPEIGYTFANGLRSVLRQDPDIIMVGEIRDEETAELAIHASLTGHLVLSTLHTNSAAGAIPRLIDMGVQPFLLASSLKLAMAQRLVRRICQECKAPVDDLPEELEREIRDDLRKVSKQTLQERGVDFDPNDPNSKLVVYEGQGCSKCQGSGMKGRIGIFEAIEITKSFSKLINKNVLGSALEEEARKDGFITMKEDGLIKVLTGLTTIEEIQRVTSEDEEVEHDAGETKGVTEKKENNGEGGDEGNYDDIKNGAVKESVVANVGIVDEKGVGGEGGAYQEAVGGNSDNKII